MDPKIIYGYVNNDRSINSGSGDFKVGEKVETGVYNIIFDAPFSDVPAITATVHDDQTGHQTGLHVSKAEEGQFTLVIVDTQNQGRYDLSFFFTAIGP